MSNVKPVKVAIIYFSHTGATKQLAQAIGAGIDADSCKHTNGNTLTHAKANAKYPSINVFYYPIKGQDIIEGRYQNPALLKQITTCDALVLGTPTYMGGVSAQLKAFIDATSDIWVQQAWADKLAAGFTCGTGLNGDQSQTLLSMFTFASQQGMVWLGLDRHYLNSKHANHPHGLNRLACQTGVVVHSPNSGEVDNRDLATAHYLGGRIKKYLHNAKS